MSDGNAVLNIDLAELEEKISQLSPEEIKAQLVEIRTKQKVQQKKYHNPEKAKAYQKKRNALTKTMADKAKALPSSDPKYKTLYEQIMAEANDAADAKIAAEKADAEDAVEAGVTEE